MKSVHQHFSRGFEPILKECCKLRMPLVHLQCVDSSKWNPVLMDELFELSNNVVAEDFDHWMTQCNTNQFVHIIRDFDTNKALGFQFWRLMNTPSYDHKVLFGGKLRYDHSIRKRRLNVISNLIMYDELINHYHCKQKTLFRAGNVNIFGFVTMARAIDNYAIYPFKYENNKENESMINKMKTYQKYCSPAIEQFCSDNHYDLNKESGFVHHTIDFESKLSKEFEQRPETQDYFKINPKWKDGYSVTVAWDIDHTNVDSMMKDIKAHL